MTADGDRFTAEKAQFFDRGWVRFNVDPVVLRWAQAAKPIAERAAADPAHIANWLRCGGTWFAGVNVYPNGPDGGVAGEDAPALGGRVLDFIKEALGLSGFAWDRAQISVCYPGYPQPSAEESEAASRYRLKRDAAHVDGLRRAGAERRRFLDERHGFLLGVPLEEAEPGAAPFTVWEGSHEVMRAAFQQAFAGVAPERWAEVDVTEIYHAARRRCFETLPRAEVAVSPGACYLAHRLSLHGMAPWRAPSNAPPRSIAYFRPDPFPGASPEWWLSSP